MNLPILSTAAKVSMTSIEIADLVNSRHDSVKRTIERLAKSGAIQLPPSVKVKDNQSVSPNSKTVVYVFEGEQGQRDSIVVVAQLCPEFTANLVDRWIELEQAAAHPKIPQTLPEALRLAADLAERVEQQQARLTVAEPKAAGFDRITQSQGDLCLRDAAKTLGIPERKFTQWLIDRRWIYRDQSQTLRPYADRVRSGHLAERISTPRQTVQGEKVFAQTIVTPAGLARLGAMAERQGKLTVVGGVA